MKFILLNAFVLVMTILLGLFIGSTWVQRESVQEIKTNVQKIKLTQPEIEFASEQHIVQETTDNVEDTFALKTMSENPIKEDLNSTFEKHAEQPDLEDLPIEHFQDSSMGGNTFNSSLPEMGNSFSGKLEDSKLEDNLDSSYFDPSQLDLGDPSPYGVEDKGVNDLRVELTNTLRDAGLSEAEIRANVLALLPTKSMLNEIDKNKRRINTKMTAEDLENQMRAELQASGVSQIHIENMLDGLFGKNRTH